jgi:2-methylcitrate dehydratase PrpD
VRVGTNRHMPNALIHHRPQNELQAKFSMEFCMAILLLERKAGLAEFTDSVVKRDDVRAMIEKVDFSVHPLAEAAGYEKMTTIIDIELADGRTITGSADFGKGSPTNPMTDLELAEKFRECAAWGGLAKPNAEKIVDLVLDLENVKSIRELTRLLAIDPSAGAAPTRIKSKVKSASKRTAQSAHGATKPKAKANDRKARGGRKGRSNK